MALQARRRTSCASSLVAVVLILAPALAGAQDLVLPISAASPLLDLTPATAAAADIAPVSTARVADRGVLVPLYISFAALQALDAHSTLRAIRAGGVEQNPMLGSIAGRPVPLIALKAGVAASTILLADTMMRGRSRTGAIVLMAALNSLYATVVARNYASPR